MKKILLTCKHEVQNIFTKESKIGLLANPGQTVTIVTGQEKKCLRVGSQALQPGKDEARGGTELRPRGQPPPQEDQATKVDYRKHTPATVKSSYPEPRQLLPRASTCLWNTAYGRGAAHSGPGQPAGSLLSTSSSAASNQEGSGLPFLNFSCIYVSKKGPWSVAQA